MSCPACNQNKPSLINKAKHFAKEVTDTVMGNSYTVNKDIQHERLAHCKQCEKLNRFFAIADSNADISLADTCDACGCPVRAKATRSEQECPLGKWGKVD